MARKIKETPILKGRDAETFDRAVEANKSKKVSNAEYERAKNTYNRIMKASKIG